MTVMLPCAEALRLWRRRARRSFVAVAVLVVAGVVGAFALPAVTVFTIVTASVMSVVAGCIASGTYSLGRAHTLAGLRPAGTGLTR